MKRTLACLTLLTLSFSPLSAMAMETSLEQQIETSTIQFQSDAPTQDVTVFGLPVNEGPIDRSLRAVLAAGLIGTGIYGVMNPDTFSQPLAYSLMGVGVIPALTSATGYCPLYQVFGINYTF